MTYTELSTIFRGSLEYGEVGRLPERSIITPFTHFIGSMESHNAACGALKLLNPQNLISGSWTSLAP